MLTGVGSWYDYTPIGAAYNAGKKIVNKVDEKWDRYMETPEEKATREAAEKAAADQAKADADRAAGDRALDFVRSNMPELRAAATAKAPGGTPPYVPHPPYVPLASTTPTWLIPAGLAALVVGFIVWKM